MLAPNVASDLFQFAMLILSNSAGNSAGTSTAAGRNVTLAQQKFEKSLERLSSGKKIVNTSDDAAGLAVSMKLAAAFNRANAAQTNLMNAQSYKLLQESSLSELGQIITGLG